MAAFRTIVLDVESAVHFYVDVLGFDLVVQYGPAFAEVQLAETVLWLSGPPASAYKPMPDGRQPEPGGWNRPVVIVEDLDATVERLQTLGVVFRNEILEGPGGKQVVIDDPSGNPIELFQPRQ